MEQEGIFQLNRYLGAGHFLVRHPGPYKTESLFGYLLRLSEVNGYWSVWPLLKFAGMKQFEARTAGMRVEKLAAIANRPVEELEAIAYYQDDSVQHCRLLNHPLLPTHLRLTKSAICPQCVKEKQFIEAHWDLNAMTGCPVHGCRLLASCPQCPAKLTVFRPRLLTCGCSNDLSNIDLPPISIEECELLDVIRRTVLRMPPDLNSRVGLPLQHLTKMKLHPLLGLIQVLGRLSRELSTGTAVDGNPSDTALASEILSNWPVRFHELLVSMITNEEEGFAGFSRGALSSLYSSLFKNQTVPDRSEVEFVLQACTDFAANRWGKGLADPKLLARFGMNGTQRFVGIGTTAKELGLHLKTARHLLNRESGTTNVANASNGERIVIDKEALKVNALLPGRIYWLREAAAKIGISVALLKSLRENGDFEVKCTPQHYRGFHEKDLELFISRIRAAVTAGGGSAESTKSIKAALHDLRFSLIAQTEFLQRILKLVIPVSGPESSAICDLFVPGKDVTSVMKKVCPWFFETITARDAAKLIGISVEDIRPLVDNKFLEPQNTPLGERLNRSSVEHFCRSYTPAETVAKSLKTSARKVTDICRQLQIPLLVIEIRSIDHALIRAEDENRVRHAYQFPDEIAQALLDKARLSATSANTNCHQTREAPNETRLRPRPLAPVGDSLTYLDAAVKLRVGKECIRLLIEAKHLDETPTDVGPRITQTSVERFAGQYISLQSIAEEHNSQPRTVRRACEILDLPLLKFRSRVYNHSFANRKDVSLILESLGPMRPDISLAGPKQQRDEEAA